MSRILNNATYKGIHEYRKGNRTKKERIVREVPAIIPEELWNRTQALLRENFVRPALCRAILIFADILQKKKRRQGFGENF
ncbi:MAG: recombinase family protein [Bacillota bacterium]